MSTVSGEVIKYSIFNPVLENIGYDQPIYLLEVQPSRNGEESIAKEEEVTRVYSKKKLSSSLFNETLKVSGKIKNDRFWLTRFSVVPPKDLPIDQSLYGITHAVNQEEYAKSNGLTLVDDKVVVIAELTTSVEIASKIKRHINIEAQSENRLRAHAPIEKLILLAEDPAVKFLHPPQEPVPLTEGGKED